MCRIRKFIHNPKIQSELFFTFWYTFGIHFDQHGFELPGFTYLYVDFFLSFFFFFLFNGSGIY